MREDPFIKEYLPDLLHTMRSAFLLELVKPYASLGCAWLADQLLLPLSETEQLLVVLILEGRLKGTVDQVARTLRLAGAGGEGGAAASALQVVAGKLTDAAGVLGEGA